MADKFLSRPDSKQRILRLDLSPVMPTYESALVVTAELARLTYFVPDSSGVWQFTTRVHDPLEVVAVGPNDTFPFPWSRRNGVAAREGVGVVVFKRSINGHVRLFVDLVGLEPGVPKLMTAMPVKIPLESLGFAGVGMDIWARFSDDELLIILQSWVSQGYKPFRPILSEPRLLLLRCPIDQLVPEKVCDPAVWTAHVLDRGGFDLDARLEPGHVWVAHRRSGEATSREVEPSDGQGDELVWIVDDPANPVGWDLSSLMGEYPPVVVVSFDLTSCQPTIEANDLPGVERPQLHSVNPIIVTGDRLHNVELLVEHHDRMRRFIPRVFSSSKWVIWRFRDRWLTGEIGMPRHWQWPLNLEEIAGSQYMIDAKGTRLALATLASLKPVVLADNQVTDKGRSISFVIEDPLSGAVVTDFYHIGVFAGPDESLRWEGRNVLDIGHEAIVRAPDNEGTETQLPAEHTQFLPFFIEAQAPPMTNGDLLQVRFGDSRGLSATRNTLGGLLVADQDMRVGLMAYVGMDDGGARVVFAPGVDPLPSKTDEHYKIFPPGIVVDPIAPGRAWVELRADDWVDARLPGYFVPTNDMLRRKREVASYFEKLAMGLVEGILFHFTPRSIGSGLQLPLDALPVAMALTPGSGFTIDDLQPDNFELDQSTALAIQTTIAGQAPQSVVFSSGIDSPFLASFWFRPGVAQAEMELTFTAAATPPAGGATFVWTFRPPQDPMRTSQPEVVQGPSPRFAFPFEGSWIVTLVATAENGARSTVSHTLQVAPSLWTQVWQAQRSISNDIVTVGATTLEISKFRIEYVVNAQGQRDRVRINYLDEHRTQLRFLSGVEQQQGRIGLRMPITISSEDAAFTGALAGILALNRINVSFNYERQFTPAISTSDRRSFDLASRMTYAELDSVEPVIVTPREADVETVRRFDTSDELRTTVTVPSAIAARPVDPGELFIGDVTMDTELSDGAGTLMSIFTVIVALGLAFLFAGPIIVAIVLASGPFGLTTALVGMSLVALVGIAIGLGLSRWLRGLVRRVLTSYVSGLAREELSKRENLALVREGLDNAGIMTYAGEGLSEAIAIMAVRQAIADGHAVEAPLHDQQDPNAPGDAKKASGRERFRNQAFETIAVGEGVCRVQLRVP